MLDGARRLLEHGVRLALAEGPTVLLHEPEKITPARVERNRAPGRREYERVQADDVQMCRRAAQGCDLVDGLLHGSVERAQLINVKHLEVTGDHLAVHFALCLALRTVYGANLPLRKWLRMKHVTFFQAAGQRDDQRIGAALPKLFANAACTLALLLLLLLLLMMLLLLLPLLLLPLNGVRTTLVLNNLCFALALLFAASKELERRRHRCQRHRLHARSRGGPESRRRLSVRRGVCLSMNQSFIRARYIVQ